MRLRLCAAALLVAACLTTACETDFDVAGNWKETIIAYGLLDVSQPKQYIRLNKAFLGEDINANAVAQIADSAALIEPVTAVLEVYNDANYNSLSTTYPLAKIDAMQEGIVKDDGTFYTSPYYLYTTAQALSSSKWYNLKVTTGKGTEISARTSVIGDFPITRPSADNGLNLSDSTFLLRWKHHPESAFYDGDIILKFAELRTDASQAIKKTVRVNVFTNWEPIGVQANEIIRFDVNVRDFFAAMLRDFGTEAANDPNVIRRDLEYIDVAIHAGNKELQTFNSVASAQLGITASQNLLSYTNIEGGLGLFASRYSKLITDLPVEVVSYEPLSCSPEGKQLKFTLHPNDVRYPFACD
ncbi:MAG: DUF4249 family protein [Sphingobacteriales bacterium]|nr:DUF4249 family protein [Sphingobacteriales bacterium]MCC7224207.1 DUF4249 family protein [Chitinophagales bacterium]